MHDKGHVQKKRVMKMRNIMIAGMLIAVILSVLFISGCTDVSGVDGTGPSRLSANSQEADSCSGLSVCDGPKAEESAQVECPFGRHDDPYPGSCGRYIDKNNDDVCDLSQ